MALLRFLCAFISLTVLLEFFYSSFFRRLLRCFSWIFYIYYGWRYQKEFNNIQYITGIAGAIYKGKGYHLGCGCVGCLSFLALLAIAFGYSFE
jgi:hypothetical protein